MKDTLDFIREVSDNIDAIASDPEVAKSTLKCMIGEMCSMCDELNALDTQLSSAAKKRGNAILNQVIKGEDAQLKIARKVLRQFHITKQREV